MNLNTAILIVCVIMTGISCKKKSDNPINDLPPLTSTGANTFGCLVNGDLFIPKAAGVSGRQPLNFSYGVENGKYSLIINVEYNTSKSLAYIQLFINSAEIKQGEDYLLVKGYPKNDKPYGQYNYRGPKDSYGTDYDTDDQGTGKVHLTYFDGKIASGTFWFDAVSVAGEKVQIREGRFDLKVK